MEKYYVIYGSEDGDARMQEFSSKESLLKFLDPEDWCGDDESLEFLEKLYQPTEDITNWGRRFMVIKGEIVVPIAKEKIVEYDIK